MKLLITIYFAVLLRVLLLVLLLSYSFSIDKSIRIQVNKLGDTNMRQRQESNPQPPKHWADALSYTYEHSLKPCSP